jgi:hypothetical protein
MIYVPPETSAYSHEDPYANIQRELDSFLQRYSSLCLFGDFNSRTRLLKDYIQVDRELFETNNSDSVFNEFTEEMLCFQNTNICIERSNNDKSVNNYGYKFIDFLHTNNLFILNGRTKGDLLGNTTSHDVSTIDYFTCSSNIFSTIDSLNVIEFCPLLSDVHTPIYLNILVGQTTRQNRQQDKQAPNLLKIENTQEFINNISRN